MDDGVYEGVIVFLALLVGILGALAELESFEFLVQFFGVNFERLSRIFLGPFLE